MNVHSIIHNSQKVETTQLSIQMQSIHAVALFGQTPACTQSSQEPEDLAVTTPILQSRQLRLRGNDVTCQGDCKELVRSG